MSGKFEIQSLEKFNSPVVQVQIYNFFIPVNTYHKHNTFKSIFCIIRLNYNVSLMLDILIKLKNNILVQKISNFEWKKFAPDRDRTRDLQIQMRVR